MYDSDGANLSKSDILHYVNGFYSNIVHALYSASCLTVPCKRHWWDEELSLLKEKAIASFRLWSALGKPRTGSQYNTILTYKLALRNNVSDSKDQFSDSLNDALMCKDISRFWQTWRSKFGRN